MASRHPKKLGFALINPEIFSPFGQSGPTITTLPADSVKLGSLSPFKCKCSNCVFRYQGRDIINLSISESQSCFESSSKDFE